MARKIIKLTETQVQQIINEDFPFNYLGSESTDVNHGDEVKVNVPIDSPDVNPEAIDGDKISKTLSNNSWWNRHYGFNGYCI